MATTRRIRAILADHLMAGAYWVVGWLDAAYVPKASPWSFTIEPGRGAVIHDAPISGVDLEKGCRLFYLNDAGYDHAHTDAGS